MQVPKWLAVLISGCALITTAAVCYIAYHGRATSPSPGHRWQVTQYGVFDPVTGTECGQATPGVDSLWTCTDLRTGTVTSRHRHYKDPLDSLIASRTRH